MPYKIVETIEKGKKTLVIVPSNWEQNNILHWPKWKVETLLAAEDSVPDASWHTMKCRIKRTGLVSKESAEAELAYMCTRSDTDVEEFENSKFQKIVHVNSIQDYFDDISKTCNMEYVKTPEPGPTHTNSPIAYVEKNNNNSDLTTTGAPDPQCESVNEAVVYVNATPDQANNCVEQNNKIEALLAITEALSQNQGIIMEYLKNIENKVLQKLSYLSAQIDSLVTINSKSQNKVDSVVFKCLSNKEELKMFEKNLEKTEFRAEIKQNLLSVCGKEKGRGVSNAYTLADIMFTRHFMTQCSWAGGSKNKIDKICFKSHTNTIDLFFEIIYESDKEFTKKECESFFKNIMRHAVTRNKPEIKRAASCKRRSQKSIIVTKPTSNSQSQNDINNYEFIDNVLVNNQPTDQLAESESFGNVVSNSVDMENN